MKKKNVSHIIAASVFVLIILSGNISCLTTSTATTAPNVSNAIDPENLVIDEQNFAYLFAPQVMSIDGNRVVQNTTRMLFGGRIPPIRVPAGRQLGVGIYCGVTDNYRRNDDSWTADSYETIQNIVIHPLENGRIYYLSTSGTDINRNQRLFLSFEVWLGVFNSETNRQEHISTQKVNLNPPVRPK